MNELTTRASKPALLFAVGMILVMAAYILPGSVRERALDRRVETALRILAEGESPTVSTRDGGGIFPGDRTWWQLNDGGVIVREQVKGYQSFLDILVRFDADRNFVSFFVILENEGAYVKPVLIEGNLDALSGATVTAEAIARTIARIQRDMVFTRGESQ